MTARLVWACTGLAGLISGGPAGAQWTAHTSSRDVSALSPASGAMWAGSAGGIFRYDAATGEIVHFTAAEGLHDVQSHTIAYDARRDMVWTGYADGVIDRLDVSTGAVTTFFDIQRNERFPSKEIHRLYAYGDSLLLATAFGLVVFDPIRSEVRDTYSQLGTLSSPVAVRDVTVAEVPDGGLGFWLATDQGIAHAPLDAPNLQDPAAWTVETDVLPSRDLYAIEAFGGTIYIGSHSGLGRRNADGYYDNTGLTTRAVPDLAALPDRLLVLTAFNVVAVFASGGATVQADGFVNLQAVAVDADGSMWIGDAETGLNHYERPSGNDRPMLITGEIYPSGPYDSPFGDIIVDSGGNLWAAAVEGLSRAGFYKLGSDGFWTNYTQRFFTELAGRSNYWRIYADEQGNAWAGSRGGGLAQVDAGQVITLYDHTNSTLLPAAGETSYVIVSGVASSQDGELWITNMAAPMPLHVRTPDGEWTALPPLLCSGLGSTTLLGSIIVDSSGLKWIVIHEQTDFRLTAGVAVLDTGDTPGDASDDECQFFGGTGAAGRGLPSVRINAITEDGDGRIWVGTNEGPAYFISSLFAATDASAQATWPVWDEGSGSTYMLRGLAVNDVVPDPAGRLWFATSDGVYLMSDVDGFEMVEHFTARNTPLFSDNVNAIAVDGGTGLVFIATDKGLISYQSNAINPAPEAQDLFIYPNPVRVTGEAVPRIVIEGLVAETDIRVITVHGEVVAEFLARGGKAVWDGRDQSGALVPSGMYLVVAVGSSGEGAAYGKVAVIR